MTINQSTLSWKNYLELCKPKVVALIIFTAIVGMLLSVPGMPPVDLLIYGTLGIGLASSSAAAINHYIDQKAEFDFNSWLLPTLELEKYEPSIEEEVGVADQIHGSTNYAWIGTGQCGGRLVKSFYDLGYKKAIALNTSHHDLDPESS